MHVLLYNQLHAKHIPHFPKMQGLLEAGDFRSADVKKIGENLYRARLDHSNRLLFSALPLPGRDVYSGARVHCQPRVRQIPVLTPWCDHRREQHPHRGIIRTRPPRHHWRIWEPAARPPSISSRR